MPPLGYGPLSPYVTLVRAAGAAGGANQICLESPLVADLQVKFVVSFLSYFQGGKYYFLDHVAAKKGSILYVLQRILNILWVRMGECHLSRETHTLLKGAGFGSVEYDYFYADEIVYPTPIVPLVSLVKPHVMGVATK